MERYKSERKGRISKLHPFREGYSVDKLLDDLNTYFEGEVDFDLEKVTELAQKKGMLENIIKAAIQKDTHPVCEFIEEIFKDSVSE
ncbi:MAG: hypothetical protein JSW17_04115 [Candidatus Omnitrophota bacterium]|nr:MAG: hypothetical protein JSW17_04115 [Candidatus Omnitrophota bacterium]